MTCILLWTFISSSLLYIKSEVKGLVFQFIGLRGRGQKLGQRFRSYKPTKQGKCYILGPLRSMYTIYEWLWLLVPDKWLLDLFGRAWASPTLGWSTGTRASTDQSSLLPRPHPAHARRRGLVSQVQILWLAPELWTSQSDRRTAFIRIMWKREQVL